MLDGRCSDDIGEVYQWKNDTLQEMSNDDMLFGNMIRIGAQLDDFWQQNLNDPVLVRLLKMGVFDWNEGDGKGWKSANQSTRHSVAIDSRLLMRILELEKKVLSSFVCD